MRTSLTFTYYKTAFTNQGQSISRSWETWRDVLSKHEIRGKPSDRAASKDVLDKQKDGPALVFGHIPPHLPRSKHNTQFADALVLDLDGLDDRALEKVLERLRPFEFVVYSSYTHGADIARGLWKLRVVAPLAVSVPRADFPKVWFAWNNFTFRSTDPATKDVSRLYYLPATFDPTLAVTFHNEGRWLDPWKDLPVQAVAAQDSPGESPALIRIRKGLQRAEGVLDKDKPAFKALADGLPFAEPDSEKRHIDMRTMTWWLADRDSCLSRASINAIFGPSISTMLEQASDAPTLDQVWSAYETAVEKLADERETRARAVQRKHAGDAYSAEELERIAEKQGWTMEKLSRLWVVQKDGAAWFLDENGEYRGPFGRDDLLMACRRFLPRTEARLVEITRAGAKPRAPATVMAEVGTLANKVVCDLTAQYTRFNADSGTMFEATAPVRTDLEPRYHEKVDKWLQVLGGRHYEKLKAWLAVLPDLNRMLCAIYFDGPKGVGKSMFARGASALWSETATPGDIELFLGSFNDTVAMCPLIFADEDLPKHATRDVTAKLREELAKTSRQLKRKFRHPAEMRGAIRLTLAANNELLIAVQKAMTPNDLEAFAERFLYIRIPDEMKDYFKGWERREVERMIVRDIAEHALHLHATIAVEDSESRFAVKGDVDDIHQLFLTSGQINGLVCEWLVKFLMNPTPYNRESNTAGLVRCDAKEQRLLANPQGIADNWSSYIKGAPAPGTSEIATALRSLSVPVVAKDGREKMRVQLRWGGRHTRYSVVNFEALLAWSRRHNIGDPASMCFALGIEATEAHLRTREIVDEDVEETPDNVAELRRKGQVPTGVREDGGLDYGAKED